MVRLHRFPRLIIMGHPLRVVSVLTLLMSFQGKPILANNEYISSMNNLHPVLVGLGLVPSTGGPSKTINLFREALDAQVVSFSDAARLEAEGSAIPGAVHLPVDGGLRGRAYSWLPSKGLEPAEALLSQANLLSCHILYRYHVHWVMRKAREHNLPYWVVPHGCLDPYVFTYRGFIKKLWMQLVGKRFLKEASAIICATQAERDKIATWYAGDNLEVVHWPVVPIDDSDRVRVRKEVRASLGIPEEDKVLVFLGRLHEMKRPLETIQAFAGAGGKGVHLLVIGPEESYTVKQCESHVRHCRAEHVHVLGPVYGKDKERYLLASDAFISLSIRENFGHTVAESLTAGLPVILSPGNDLSGELKSVGCGWFLRDDDLGTAVAAIRVFAQASPDEIKALGQKGKDWALKELTFEHFAQKIQSLARRSIEMSGS